jgi:ankyrin repeat/SOCS box protein 2
VANRKLGVVKFLVSQGAELEAKDKYEKTPFYIAAEQGYLEAVKFLAKQGAEINVTSQEGMTPLNAAEANSFGAPELRPVIKYLREKGAKSAFSNPEKE